MKEMFEQIAMRLALCGLAASLAVYALRSDMTKGFSIYFALCIKNRMFYDLNDSIIATFSSLDLRLVLYNLAEITGKGQRTPHKT